MVIGALLLALNGQEPEHCLFPLIGTFIVLQLAQRPLQVTSQSPVAKVENPLQVADTEEALVKVLTSHSDVPLRGQ